jgi:hypothetical protein
MRVKGSHKQVVIPTFFVCFNISAIVGSAILYGDFENVQVHQFTTFLYGCATTFLGVFLLTRSSEEAGISLEEPVALSDGAQSRRESIRDSAEGQSGQAGPAGLPVLRGKQSSASLVLSPGKVSDEGDVDEMGSPLTHWPSICCMLRLLRGGACRGRRRRTRRHCLDRPRGNGIGGYIYIHTKFGSRHVAVTDT